MKLKRKNKKFNFNQPQTEKKQRAPVRFYVPGGLCRGIARATQSSSEPGN